MSEPRPLRWTATRPVSGLLRQVPIFYTAPGGWKILHDPDAEAPDRPWLLLRHSTRLGRFHTLRLAKSAPTRADLVEKR